MKNVPHIYVIVSFLLPNYIFQATDKDIDPRYKDITYKIQGSTSFELKNKNELYLRKKESKNVLGQTVTVIVEAFNQVNPKEWNSINITITFKVR